MRVSMRFAVIITLIAMGMTTLSLNTTGPVSAQTAPKQYVLVGAGDSLPADLDALVASVGGQVLYRLDEIGVVVAESAEPSFVDALSNISGLQGVAEDRPVPLALPDQGDSTVVESLDATWETAAAEGLNPAQAKFFFAQWNLKAVGAPAAWSAGFKGDPRVKVAVLDTGIDYAQQEMVGQVDMTLSRSFFSEPLPPGAAPFLDVQGHGTHVAGIIAAKGISVAGIAPDVKLLAIKVAGRSGFATWGAIIAAIKYAADVGADVINMSFGDILAKSGGQDAQLMAALNRAVNYAYGKGALLVASAGNSDIDWDRRICESTDGSGNLVMLNCPTGKLPSNMTYWNVMKVPAQLPHVVAVSSTGAQATGPLGGFSLDGWNMDAMGVAPAGSQPAQVYTDHGMSIINLSAPGGSVTLVFNPVTGKYVEYVEPTMKMPVHRILSACARFTPGVNCTSGRANIFMIGTSMAAAHVSAVAALIDSAAGGTLTGDQITQILMQSADDFGKVSYDEWYGFGRINAYRAVTGK